MTIKVNYFDSTIVLEDGKVFVIEIENKKYFYRFIKDLYDISSGNIIDDITIFDHESEVKTGDIFKLVIDYFNFSFDSRKYENDITKFVSSNINDIDKDSIVKLYQKLVKLYNKVLNDIDLPLKVSSDITIDIITKMMKIGIVPKNDLLENLLLLIDLEKVLKTNQIIIFVNLKQYLTKEELIELYKYSIYNQVKILLIDSICYGGTIKYEKKLILDDNLDEFMI